MKSFMNMGHNEHSYSVMETMEHDVMGYTDIDNAGFSRGHFHTIL